MCITLVMQTVQIDTVTQLQAFMQPINNAERTIATVQELTYILVLILFLYLFFYYVGPNLC